MRGRAGGTARRWLRSAPALAAAVVLPGLLVSVALGGVLAAHQRANAAQQMQRRTQVAATELANAAGRYVDAVRTVAAAVGAFENLTAVKFAEVTRVVGELQLPGATSVLFLVPVTDEQIPAVQQRWARRGLPGLRLQPAGPGREHIFTIFNTSLDGDNRSRSGIDVTQSAPPTQALTQARSTGRAAMSDPYELIIDQQLPAEQRQLSFSLTMPVYGPPSATGERPFHGWVLMALRGRDFIAAALDRVSQDLIDVSLSAPRSDGTLPLVASSAARVTGKRDLSETTTLSVADRQWHLQVSAPGRRLPGGLTGMPTVATTSAASLSVLLAGLVSLLATGRARAQHQVEVATADLAATAADLRGARDDLVAQKDYLTQVLDTLDVAVLTCDPGGRVVHSNRAARLQLPGTEKPLTAAAGLRHPDGTLIPDNQQPLVRALAGEDVHGLEVQYTSPGGTHHAVMLHARPLRDTEGHIIGAVHASVDVTTLRQREAELRVFAGVVAHDLRSPLSSIAGYAEVLHNGLTDGAPTDQLHDDLGRIRGAVDRMRRLIEDLLTYATAHDAPLRPEPVNLRTVVADVVTDRTAHMRAPTSGEPVMFPDIHIGSLPMVSADAAMLRQLFDNLIGNALKYTQPGQPARIEISAHHHTSATPEDDVDGTVWVRVEVADCGIGIPAADQPHIFDTFHRSPAHTGYHGTGLGLAICERIAHRHGGTITVADNPGGGTRFAVTLPLTSPVLPTAPHPEARSLAEPSAACP